jgi:glucokinase
MTLRIGLDLGGTNLRAAAFDGESIASPGFAGARSTPEGSAESINPRWTHRELVGDARSPEAIVERVAAVADRLASDAAGPIPIGVGIAAMLSDRRGTVALSPHLRWRDVAFGELLARRLGSRFQLGVYNDVNAITWGEVTAGAARGCRDVLAVYVGTGIGGGVVAGGQLVEGTANCAGEIGHVKVRWDDKAEPCACGGRGCIEAYIGGSYLDRRIARELAGRTRALAAQLAGRVEDVTVTHVDEAAGAGDEWALALWSELAPLLAVALGNAICVLNPERLVLGGGLLARTPTLVSLVETALMIVPPPPHLAPLSIRMAELGDNAGLVGAAALAAAGVSLM